MTSSQERRYMAYLRAEVDGLRARLAEAERLLRKFACGDPWCQTAGADFCTCELKQWLEPTVRAADSASAQESVKP